MFGYLSFLCNSLRDDCESGPFYIKHWASEPVWSCGAKNCSQRFPFLFYWTRPLRACLFCSGKGVAPHLGVASPTWEKGCLSPVLYQRSYYGEFSRAKTSLWSFCPPKFKNMHPVLSEWQFLAVVKWRRTETCIYVCPLTQPPCTGQGEGIPFSIQCGLFIYLFIWDESSLLQEFLPLRDNSSGSRWIHLLPWWCAHSFCWLVSTSISPFLLSARWKCLQVLQS